MVITFIVPTGHFGLTYSAYKLQAKMDQTVGASSSWTYLFLSLVSGSNRHS